MMDIIFESIPGDYAAQQLFGKDRKKTIQSKHCLGCGNGVIGFSDRESKSEYLISGMCQECQDEIFAEPEEDDQ